MYSGVFHVTFLHFASHFSLFAFRSILCWGRHSHRKSKDFKVYFFAALIKRKICIKYEKCILSISYFVVCFAKTFTKYLRNVKYRKCGLMSGARKLQKLTFTLGLNAAKITDYIEKCFNKC